MGLNSILDLKTVRKSLLVFMLSLVGVIYFHRIVNIAFITLIFKT